MRLSARFSLPLQAVLGLALGATVGVLLGAREATSPWAQAAAWICEWLASVGLLWLHFLAAPLIVSSIVLGGIGLEAMRGMGKLVRKTLAWMLGGSLAALGIAAGVSGIFNFHRPSTVFTGTNSGLNPVGTLSWDGRWLGLVFLSLAFGFYRNQLEEGQGKLLMRFCLALENIMKPLLRWTEAVSPIVIFFLMASTVETNLHWWTVTEDTSNTPFSLHQRSLLLLGSVVCVYLAVLMFIVRTKTKSQIWRSFVSLAPACCVAMGGLSLIATLPVLMQIVRERAGVSTRVASVTLPLGAVLQRDGMVLGWSVVAFGFGGLNAFAHGLVAPVYALLLAITMGCSGDAMATQSGMIVQLAIKSDGTIGGIFPELVVLLILCLSNAVQVVSYFCSTVCIARSEGEYWVPGPPPSDDELQQLRSDLDSAEG